MYHRDCIVPWLTIICGRPARKISDRAGDRTSRIGPPVLPREDQ